MAAWAKMLFLYSSGPKSRTSWNNPSWWSTTNSMLLFLSILSNVNALPEQRIKVKCKVVHYNENAHVANEPRRARARNWKLSCIFAKDEVLDKGGQSDPPFYTICAASEREGRTADVMAHISCGPLAGGVSHKLPQTPGDARPGSQERTPTGKF